MRIANVATYPAREHTCLPALRSIAGQVDRLNLTLNEYTEVPETFRTLENVSFHLPEWNLKDLGKFCFKIYLLYFLPRRSDSKIILHWFCSNSALMLHWFCIDSYLVLQRFYMESN